MIPYYLSALMSAAILQPPTDLSLTIEPNTVQYGNAATLKWKVSSAEQVYITGIGRVAYSGALTVHPERTTNYVLIAESSGRLNSKSVGINVEGARGTVKFPADDDPFQFPVSGKRSVSSLVTFLDRTRKILQDEMKFSVKEEPNVEGRRHVFVTNMSERSELVHNERQIGARRISYRVEIESPQSKPLEAVFTIKTLIQYRRKIESTWRTESAETLYSTEAGKLKMRIEQEDSAK